MKRNKTKISIANNNLFPNSNLSKNWWFIKLIDNYTTVIQCLSFKDETVLVRNNIDIKTITYAKSVFTNNEMKKGIQQ